MKRIPNIAITQALVKLLREHLDVPVTDHLDESSWLPYVSIGAFTCEDDRTKVDDLLKCSIDLHIWSEYAGKAQVNSIAEKIISVLNTYDIDVSADGFNVFDGKIAQYEAYEEETYGYNGIITLDMSVQNLK